MITSVNNCMEKIIFILNILILLPLVASEHPKHFPEAQELDEVHMRNQPPKKEDYIIIIVPSYNGPRNDGEWATYLGPLLSKPYADFPIMQRGDYFPFERITKVDKWGPESYDQCWHTSFFAQVGNTSICCAKTVRNGEVFYRTSVVEDGELLLISDRFHRSHYYTLEYIFEKMRK